MIVGLLEGVVSLVIGIVAGGLTIYIGLPLGASRTKPTIEEAFVTAGVGAVLSVAVSLLLGWIPIIGVLLPLAAWIGVVGHRTAARPATTVAVGLVTWAVTLIITTGLTTLAFGGVQ